jgi:hypothetical protein
MQALKPKDFIKQVFIDDLAELASTSPYIAFAIMAIGIEFLGKCLDTDAVDWNVPYRAKRNFIKAISQLTPLSNYRPHAHFLYTNLRCGFAHSFVPKAGLTLSSKKEMPHLHLHGNNLNLKCEDFYIDFKKACEAVIGMGFLEGNKMNRDLMEIPSPGIINNAVLAASGTTSIGTNPSGNNDIHSLDASGTV